MPNAPTKDLWPPSARFAGSVGSALNNPKSRVSPPDSLWRLGQDDSDGWDFTCLSCVWFHGAKRSGKDGLKEVLPASFARPLLRSGGEVRELCGECGEELGHLCFGGVHAGDGEEALPARGGQSGNAVEEEWS